MSTRAEAFEERAWLRRALLVLVSPREVFERLSDDSVDAARARSEALLALVWLAGMASVLWTPVGGKVLNDVTLDWPDVLVWAFIGGGIYAVTGYFGGGLILYWLTRAVGGLTYRQVRHVLGFAAAPVAAAITETLSVPTIGIGAGRECDGQVLVYHDLLGLTEGHLPRFVKRYANLSREIRDALEHFAADVRSGTFPEDQHTYEMPAEELEAFARANRNPSRSSASDQATSASSSATKTQLPEPRSAPPLRKTSSP